MNIFLFVIRSTLGRCLCATGLRAPTWGCCRTGELLHQGRSRGLQNWGCCSLFKPSFPSARDNVV